MRNARCLSRRPLTELGSAGEHPMSSASSANNARKRRRAEVSIGGETISTDDVTSDQLRACADAFPKHERYDLIVADPPWSYRACRKSVNGIALYPTMTADELARVPVATVSSKQCVLLMWATWPMLEIALGVIKAWGFEYKTCYKMWRKVSRAGNPIVGVGWYSRGNTEVLLVATKGRGNASRILRRNVMQEHTECRTALHSEKPSSIMSDIVADIRAESRIELFARVQHPGFACWGLEIDGFFKRASSPRDTVT